MSSDEEPDYMSDDFLKQCVPDVRPGLIGKSTAKKLATETKQKEADQKSKTKPLKLREIERREEGLQKSLTEDNKGFALMQKMGYKTGMVLGKKGQGRKEPVPIEVKTGRGGLGRDSDIKSRIDKKLATQKARQHLRTTNESRLRTDFRQRMVSQRVEKEVGRDLYRSQRVCEQLDIDIRGLEAPDETYYWIKRKRATQVEDEDDKEEEEEEEDEDDEISDVEKLTNLTRYLRLQFNYCVWCGTSYDDDKDLSGNCPGPTADDHR